MQFSWTTFFIEFINFLVLIWILKRLLYMPVKNAIERRKHSIQETLDEARQLKKQGKSLEEKYEHRLTEWEKEKEGFKKALKNELAETKTKELDKLQKTLAQEREKAEAIAAHHLKEQAKSNVHESMLLAAQFAAKFLKGFADADLETKIIDAFIEDLSKIPSNRLEQLKSEIEKESTIVIESAFPLQNGKKQFITDQFDKNIRQQIHFNFEQKPGLLAGINVKVGAISLQANLRDELKFFAEVICGSSKG